MNIVHEAVCMAVATGEENLCDCIKESAFLEPIPVSTVWITLHCPYPQCNWNTGSFPEGATVCDEDILDVMDREYREHCLDEHA